MGLRPVTERARPRAATAAALAIGLGLLVALLVGVAKFEVANESATDVRTGQALAQRASQPAVVRAPTLVEQAVLRAAKTARRVPGRFLSWLILAGLIAESLAWRPRQGVSALLGPPAERLQLRRRGPPALTL